MRKLLVLIAFSFLVGCSSSTDPKPVVDTPTDVIQERPVWVKNAKWETVRTDVLKTRSVDSRAIDSLDALNEEISLHNAAHPEDPWRIYLDTVPSIDEAPMCEIWIVDPVTNVLKTNPSTGGPYHLLFARVEVVTRLWAWEMDAAAVGGKLYVDYPPPPEVPAPVYDEAYWYAYYSLYVVGSTGLIHYQIHITEEDWAAGGYLNRDNMFDQKYNYFNAIAVGDGVGQPDSPWHVVARQIYVEP